MPWLGGSAANTGQTMPDADALAAMDNVTVMTRTTAFGQYDGNFNHVGGGTDSIVNQVLCRGTSAG